MPKHPPVQSRNYYYIYANKLCQAFFRIFFRFFRYFFFFGFRKTILHTKPGVLGFFGSTYPGVFCKKSSTCTSYFTIFLQAFQYTVPGVLKFPRIFAKLFLPDFFPLNFAADSSQSFLLMANSKNFSPSRETALHRLARAGKETAWTK